MDEDFKTERDKFKESLDRAKAMMTLGGIMAFFGFVGLIIRVPSVMLLCFGMLVIGLALLFSNIQSMNRAYDRYSEEKVVPMVKEAFPNAVFYNSVYSDEALDTFGEYRLFNTGGTQNIRNYLGTNDGRDMSVFSLHCINAGDESTNDTETFEGTLVRFYNQNDFKGTARIVCTSGVGLGILSWKSAFVSKTCKVTPEHIDSVDLGGEEFIDLYADSGLAFRYNSEIQGQDALKVLLGKFKEKYGKFALVVTEDKVLLSFDDEHKFIPKFDDIVEMDDNPFPAIKKQLEELVTDTNEIIVKLQ